MAITIERIDVLDNETIDVYRLLNTQRDANGDYTAGYVLEISGISCNFSDTRNFDEKLGHPPVILKRQNLVTSNEVTCSNAYDIRDEDVIYRHSNGTYETIVGDPTQRPDTSHQEFYTTPLKVAPKIHA